MNNVTNNFEYKSNTISDEKKIHFFQKKKKMFVFTLSPYRKTLIKSFVNYN